MAKLLDVAADKPQQVMAALPALLGLPEGETPLQVWSTFLLSVVSFAFMLAPFCCGCTCSRVSR